MIRRATILEEEALQGMEMVFKKVSEKWLGGKVEIKYIINIRHPNEPENVILILKGRLIMKDGKILWCSIPEFSTSADGHLHLIQGEDPGTIEAILFHTNEGTEEEICQRLNAKILCLVETGVSETSED